MGPSNNILCALYLIKNLINGNFYIGTAVNPISRKKEHFSGYKSSPYLSNAIKKYGVQNFSYEIINYYSNIEEACLDETALISSCKLNGQKIYNIHEGGTHPLLNWYPTKDQLEIILELQKKEYTCTYISKRINIDKCTLKKWAINNNINFSKYKMKNETKLLLRSQRLGIPTGRIGKNPKISQSKLGTKKLPVEIYEKIIQLYKFEKRISKIGKILNITHDTVSRTLDRAGLRIIKKLKK